MKKSMFLILFIILIILVSCNSKSAEDNNEDNTYSEKELEKDAEIVVEDDSIYHIYIDADWGTEYESSKNIELGIRTALYENDYMLNGKKVKIIRINHKTNPDIHLYNLQNTIMKDEKTLAVFTGLHSPPIIANKDFINDNQILTLDPWATGTTITRSYPSNWIFRLSIDGKYAGKKIIDYALENKKYKKFAICVVDDGWGKSNIISMESRIKELNLEKPLIYEIPLNSTALELKSIIRKISNSDIDSILMIAHPGDSVVFVRAMSELDENYKLPILSYWSVTSKTFLDAFSDENNENYFDISKVDLSFLQTIFTIDDDLINFNDEFEIGSLGVCVEINKAEDIIQPQGFVHAYDLTKILIEAANEVELSGIPKEDKIKIHYALENLENPVNGIIKVYDKPFSKYSIDNDDAHEALDISDYVILKFDENGKMIKP